MSVVEYITRSSRRGALFAPLTFRLMNESMQESLLRCCYVQYTRDIRLFNMPCQTFCCLLFSVISRETDSMTSRPSLATGSTFPLRWRLRLQNLLGGRAALMTVTEAFQEGKSSLENNRSKKELIAQIILYSSTLWTHCRVPVSYEPSRSYLTAREDRFRQLTSGSYRASGLTR